MKNSLQLLEWDTEFFGYGIAKLIADEISVESIKKNIEAGKNNRAKLVYIFTKPTDNISNDTANSVSAKLVDQKVTYHIHIPAETAATDSHIENFNGSVPSAKLIDLAIQSGLYSRYKVDENFRNNEFEKLYIKWIENSVNKQIADHTLIYKEDGNELGFVTLKLKEGFGEIGLIAVDETSRGKSIGKKLVIAVMNILREKNIMELEVATQKNNKDACNFYEKVGFKENRTENIYHIWI